MVAVIWENVLFFLKLSIFIIIIKMLYLVNPNA